MSVMSDARLRIAFILIASSVASGSASMAGPATDPPGAGAPRDPFRSTKPPATRVTSKKRAASPVVPAGVRHPLEKGLTLAALSRAYRVPVKTLLQVNGIVDPTSIPAGTPILIPGATRVLPVKPTVVLNGPRFAWPLIGSVTSRFGVIKRDHRHVGIDIDGDEGEPVAAAADGRVSRTIGDAQYGLLVILDHPDGYETWYAHASRVLVSDGDMVKAGQSIALVGDSGNARGTHLHFEVRRNGRPVDPMSFLTRASAAKRARARRG
jgi:LysM repeat protein